MAYDLKVCTCFFFFKALDLCMAVDEDGDSSDSEDELEQQATQCIDPTRSINEGAQTLFTRTKTLSETIAHITVEDEEEGKEME
jgi:hypothetical protein